MRAPARSPRRRRLVRAGKASAMLIRGYSPAPTNTQFDEVFRVQQLPAPRRITRRTAFLSGLGALAAGLLGGIGLDHLLERRAGGAPSTRSADRRLFFRPTKN